jgi:Domain of unknown function (DUF4838)
MNFSRISRKTFLKGVSSAVGWALISGCAPLVPSRATSDPDRRWRNSLKPAGTPAAGIKFAEHGKPCGVILLPQQPTTEEAKAAADLQHWISQMTGAMLPLTSVGGEQNTLEICTADSLGNEGYEISIKENRILLSGGRTRGTINAVYALLEEDLGCRFYTNDSIRVPQSHSLVIAPAERRVVPQLRIRDPFYACAFDADWSLRNRTNAPNAAVPEEYGGHMDYGDMFVHTAAQLVPPDEYFKTHPEYFAMQEDGTRTPAQLCATEPAVARIAIDHVRQFLKGNPDVAIVSVSKNDCVVACHCPRCKPLREAEGSDMANQLVLVNQVAEAVETDYPGVTVDTLAYLDTIAVPKTARPRRNVAVRLCNDAVGSWTHPFTPAEQCDIAKIAREWNATGCQIYIWDYTVNYSHYLAPMPDLDVIAADIRFWIQNGARGVMLEGAYQGPGDQDELKSWVAAKLMWNPSLDENILAEDFIRGHYGKAAPALEEYQQLLIQMRVQHQQEMASPKDGIRYPMDAPFITKEFIIKAKKQFVKARQLANGDDRLTRDVERAELPVLYVQCVRGPEFTAPENYADVVAEFERIGRNENVKYLQEGAADFETRIAEFKKRIPRA